MIERLPTDDDLDTKPPSTPPPPPVWCRHLFEGGGSKAGAHSFLRENRPQLEGNLPAGTVHYVPGEGSKDHLLGSLDGTYPKIVRMCHLMDVEYLINSVPSVVAETREQVSEAVDKILRFAESPEFKAYFEYDIGGAYDGKMSVLVQDWCGPKKGSILEHPHQRGIYRISHVSPVSEMHTMVTEDVCRDDGKPFDLDAMRGKNPRDVVLNQSTSHHAGENGKIISLYRQVAESGMLSPNISFQMEYGISSSEGKVMCYQVRPFHRFETPIPMDMSSLNGARVTRYMTNPYNCFGVCPEGVGPMPISSLFSHHMVGGETPARIAYQYSVGGNSFVDLPLTGVPRNMAAYMTEDTAALGRRHFRFMQKSKVTFLGIPKKRMEDLEAVGRSVTVFSDGIQGVVCYVQRKNI